MTGSVSFRGSRPLQRSGVERRGGLTFTAPPRLMLYGFGVINDPNTLSSKAWIEVWCRRSVKMANTEWPESLLQRHRRAASEVEQGN